MQIRSALIAVGLLFAFSGVALATEAAGPAPEGVKLEKRGHGWMLTDAKGMTLYTTILDEQPGVSSCVGPCAKIWPPFAAAPDAQAVGDWTVITRNDGAKQWAYRGKPIYAYSNDTGPGNTYGDEVALQWNVAIMPVTMPSSVTVTKTLLGHVLSDRKGLTLYTYDKDSSGKSACDAACARTWLPAIAPEMATAHGDWTVIVRADGIRQWAYQNRPVYRFFNDVHPADTRGDGVDGKWHAAVLEPPPPRPSWVKVEGSDAGELFAGPDGRTLYIRNAGRRQASTVVGAGPNSPNCGDECTGSPWQPLLAKPDDKPVGNWAIIARADGGKQWAYRGQPIYTHALDKGPGDTRGIRTGDGRIFATIMRNGQPMQGTGV